MSTGQNLFCWLLTLLSASQSRSRSNSISRSRKNSLINSALNSPESSKLNQERPPLQNELSNDEGNSEPQSKEACINNIKSPIPNINIEEPPEV